MRLDDWILTAWNLILSLVVKTNWGHLDLKHLVLKICSQRNSQYLYEWIMMNNDSVPISESLTQLVLTVVSFVISMMKIHHSDESETFEGVRDTRTREIVMRALA